MEDWEIKKAYQIVFKDLWEICCVSSTCSGCPIKEACDKCEEGLYATIKTVIEKLYGKEEEK